MGRIRVVLKLMCALKTASRFKERCILWARDESAFCHFVAFCCCSICRHVLTVQDIVKD